MHKQGVSLERAKLAKSRVAEVLGQSGLFEIVCVGICQVGEGHGVKVGVKAMPRLRGGTVPQEVDGVPLVIEVIGRIEARGGGQ